MNKWFTNKNKNKKLDSSCDNKTIRANNAFTKKYGNSFLKQEIGCLRNLQQESCSFYGLRKIGKSKIIPKAIEE